MEMQSISNAYEQLDQRHSELSKLLVGKDEQVGDDDGGLISPFPFH